MAPRVFYPCGCSASGGLLPLPEYCPIHGVRDRVREAAPDLLAALKLIIKSHDASCPGEDCRIFGIDLARNLIAKIEANHAAS